MLTIAKGYETNWNVSTSDVNESEYSYDPENRSNQDSRTKAIRTYEHILSAFRHSGEAEIAKLRLQPLRLGVDSDRKDYFFIYDLYGSHPYLERGVRAYTPLETAQHAHTGSLVGFERQPVQLKIFDQLN